jgi:hypothetical protein
MSRLMKRPRCFATLDDLRRTAGEVEAVAERAAMVRAGVTKGADTQ